MSARTGGGGGGLAKCRQMQTGGGGSKIAKNVRTSFMDGPLVIKKLKSDFAVPSNCDKFYSPILNEEIFKNRNIHSYYKRNDRRWFDLQNLILKSSTAVMNIANICLDADNKNRLIESKEVVVKATDAITLLGIALKQITFERKERLRSALSEDYRSICDQAQSSSKFL